MDFDSQARLTDYFDRRLELIPDSWRGPIVEVVDTIETVKMGLRAIGIDDNLLLIEAVRLALDRYDKAKAELRRQVLEDIDEDE